jgi:hypothetical protein
VRFQKERSFGLGGVSEEFATNLERIIGVGLIFGGAAMLVAALLGKLRP